MALSVRAAYPAGVYAVGQWYSPDSSWKDQLPPEWHRQREAELNAAIEAALKGRRPDAHVFSTDPTIRALTEGILELQRARPLAAAEWLLVGILEQFGAGVVVEVRLMHGDAEWPVMYLQRVERQDGRPAAL